MARRGRSASRKTRKNRSLSLISRLYSPLNHLFKATGNSARKVSRGVGNVAGKVVGTVSNVGKTYARETDRAIRNLTSGRRSSRKNRSTRRRRN